jgi:MFS family permease
MNKKFIIEFVIFFSYAMFAFSWVAGSILSPSIMEEFQVGGITASTYATNAITFAKIIGNLVAAWFLVKLKPKKAFAFASLLVVAGGIGVLASSYQFYVFTRLILGFGGAFIIVYFNPVVLHYFNAKERPTVNGLNSVAFNTGNLLALLFTTLLLDKLGTWQNVILLIAGVCFVFLALWWLVSDDFPLNAPATAGSVAEKTYTMRDGIKDPFNWILPFGYSGLLFCYISVFSLFPLLPSFAVPGKNLSAIMIAAGMVGILAGIPFTKKFVLRIPIMRYCGLLMTVCATIMILTANSVVAYSSAFFLGFFMFAPLTAMFSLPQELPGMTPARVTVIFSMFWSVSYIIETILMFCAGVMADSTGDTFVAAIFVVACSSSFFIASFFLPETGRRNAANQ